MATPSPSDDGPLGDERSLRIAIVSAMRTMLERGLNTGTSGNVSARWADGYLISPTGRPANELHPDDVVAMDGRGHARQGRPSSEWRLHEAVLRTREDVGAVVHCHARFATVLACSRRPIPAVHYLVGLAGGNEIPVAPYATFGTVELADSVAATLQRVDACLLANHGLVACGADVDAALSLAEEVEELAAIQWHALAVGGAVLLDDEEMDEVHRALDGYRSGGSTPVDPSGGTDP